MSLPGPTLMETGSSISRLAPAWSQEGVNWAWARWVRWVRWAGREGRREGEGGERGRERKGWAAVGL